MSEECDLCDATDLDTRVELRNPYFSNGTFQKLVSQMVVCEDCYEAMKESDDWEL